MDSTPAEKRKKNQLCSLKSIKSITRAITVEPIAVFLVAPRMISTLALDNLFLEKACLVNLALNETICEAMVVRNSSGYTSEDEVAVQRVVSNLLPYQSLSYIFQIFLILLIGNLSDKTGKKRPMFLVPYSGDILATIGYLICVYFFMEFSLEYPFFIEAFLSVASGSVPLMMAGIYSYIALITTPKTRTVRVGAISIVIRTSLTLGMASSGFMYKYLGFYGVFYVSLIMNLIGLAYIFLIFREIDLGFSHSKKPEDGLRCSSLWSGVIGSITDSVGICFKSGPNRRRTRMILLQLVNTLSFGITSAERTILYLFSRKHFGWSEVNFSIFKTYKTIIEISGCTFILILLSKRLQWNDTQIALVACFSRFIGTAIMTFSNSGLLFYIGALADSFNGALNIAVRSMVTKTVQPNEQALANSLTGIFDSLGSFLIGSLYGFVYYRTVAYFPGTFFIVSFSIYVLIFIMLIILKKIIFEEESSTIHQEETDGLN